MVSVVTAFTGMVLRWAVRANLSHLRLFLKDGFLARPEPTVSPRCTKSASRFPHPPKPAHEQLCIDQTLLQAVNTRMTPLADTELLHYQSQYYAALQFIHPESSAIEQFDV